MKWRSSGAALSRPDVGRSGALDVLRITASLWILAFHMADFAGFRGGLWSLTNWATNLLIVLSGFVLAKTYGARGLGTAEFLRRRLTRVWPGHAAALLTMVAFASAGLLRTSFPMRIDWGALVPNLLLMQAWGLSRDWVSWNGPTWTLSALLVCYATFPRMWSGLERIGRPYMTLGIGVAGYVGVAAFVHCATPYDLTGNLRWLGVARALPLFLLGVLAYRAFPNAGGSWGTSATAHLGRLSWSLYVTHWTVAALLVGVAGPVVAALVAIAVAWLFQRYVDDPIQRAIARSTRKGSATAHVVLRPIWRLRAD